MTESSSAIQRQPKTIQIRLTGWRAALSLCSLLMAFSCLLVGVTLSVIIRRNLEDATVATPLLLLSVGGFVVFGIAAWLIHGSNRYVEFDPIKSEIRFPDGRTIGFNEILLVVTIEGRETSLGPHPIPASQDVFLMIEGVQGDLGVKIAEFQDRDLATDLDGQLELVSAAVSANALIPISQDASLVYRRRVCSKLHELLGIPVLAIGV